MSDNDGTFSHLFVSMLYRFYISTSAVLLQVLELQHTLADLSSRVEAVKAENCNLVSENQILGQYIEKLMATSSIFQSSSEHLSSATVLPTVPPLTDLSAAARADPFPFEESSGMASEDDFA